MRWTYLIALVLGAAVTLSGQANAQERAERSDEPEWAQQHERRRTERREQARRRLETVRIARLTQELDLDAETAVRLVPLIKKNDALHQQQRHQRKQLGDAARLEVEAAERDDDRLAALVKEFWDQEEQFVLDRRDVFDEIAAVLTPEQQLRFIEFGPRFEREMRKLMRDIQRQNRPDDHHGRRRGDRPPPHPERPNDANWWEDGPAPDGPMDK